MSVFILILLNESNTFQCKSTHAVYSFVTYCKQGLTCCSHKKLNLNLLVLKQQAIRTLERCAICMRSTKRVSAERIAKLDAFYRLMSKNCLHNFVGNELQLNLKDMPFSIV
jgi:hypothetical protein